jgi:drug/metabolite transporter (DMT)-like permease
MIPIFFRTSSQMNIVTAVGALSPTAILSIIYMAIFSGTLAHAFYYKAQKSIEIGETSITFYLTPIWAAPLSVLWLKEPISNLFVLAAIVTALGAVIAETKPHRLSYSKPKK